MIGAKFSVSAGEDSGGFFWEVDAPFAREDGEDAQGAARAEPTLGDLFQVLDSVDNVSTGILVGEIQEVYCAGGMGDVNSNIAYLP